MKHIRLANKNDVYSIKHMIHSQIHHFSKDDVPQWVSTSLTYNQIVKRLNDNQFLHYVCEVNKKVVGYLAINQQHVHHFFVNQEYQKQGVAKTMWKNFLGETSFKKLTVRSSLNAIGFYEKMGFIRKDIQHCKGVDFCNMNWEKHNVS
ncbi:GNAT family N-acetyltransferase [Marinicellulosiphila megalodicopiae]|uniref:GNAT family N-acetyltransferase n=1 Tax=Marinicellulosiphila megalodicopiae TaxID=2724896 RepID=UPI003BAE333C